MGRRAAPLEGNPAGCPRTGRSFLARPLVLTPHRLEQEGHRRHLEGPRLLALDGPEGEARGRPTGDLEEGVFALERFRPGVDGLAVLQVDGAREILVAEAQDPCLSGRAQELDEVRERSRVQGALEVRVRERGRARGDGLRMARQERRLPMAGPAKRMTRRRPQC